MPLGWANSKLLTGDKIGRHHASVCSFLSDGAATQARGLSQGVLLLLLEDVRDLLVCQLSPGLFSLWTTLVELSYDCAGSVIGQLRILWSSHTSYASEDQAYFGYWWQFLHQQQSYTLLIMTATGTVLLLDHLAKTVDLMCLISQHRFPGTAVVVLDNDIGLSRVSVTTKA